MGYKDPDSRFAWRSVGVERGRDGDALKSAGRVLASIYMYGFEAECYAKGIIISDGSGSVPQSHDLMALYLKTGMRRETLPPELREFAETRDVSLRYQSVDPPELDEAAVIAATRFAGWLMKHLDRHELAHRRRRRVSASLPKR